MFLSRKIVLFFFVLFSLNFFGQRNPKEYYDFVKKANALYKAKDYRKSAEAYSLAFKTIGWKGYAEDRYGAACSWALANYTDSAFFQLHRIANKPQVFADYDRLKTDPDLISLHVDRRWKSLLDMVKKNKTQAEINFNWPLVYELDSIFEEDQRYREMVDSVGKKFGYASKEVMFLWRIINGKDAGNLIKVKRILEKYGWLSWDVVGTRGNTTLFLVIQHSDQKTQEKYLPLMREAVKKGRANGSSLALLEDRVALKQGKKQIYGSQITNIGGRFYLSPIEDEANVNKRRAAVGLEPIEEYVREWGLVYKPGMSNAVASKVPLKATEILKKANWPQIITLSGLLLSVFLSVILYLRKKV